MKIRMLESAAGPAFKPDGVAAKGAVLDLDEKTAQSLINEGLAVLVEAEKASERRETAIPEAISRREKRKK